MQLKSAQTGLAQAQGQADIARAQGEAWKMRNETAGIYVDPQTGEVTRMSPKDAVERRQADATIAERASGRIKRNYTWTNPRTGQVYTGLTGEEAAKLDATGGLSESEAAAAREGATTAAGAGRTITAVQAEIDSLKGDAIDGRQSISQKDAAFTKRANEIIQAAPVLRKPSMAQAMAQAQAEDPDFVKGTYHDTVANTEAKEKRLQELETEKRNAQKEQRGGEAKASRMLQAPPPQNLSKNGAPLRFSRAKLPEIAKRLGLATTAAAEKYVTDNGGTVY
jgi:hypothetical protein